MVYKSSHNDNHEGPPPLDESWWEAVLAEDEALPPVHPAPRAAPRKTTPHNGWQPAEPPEGEPGAPKVGFPAAKNHLPGAAASRPPFQRNLDYDNPDWDKAFEVYEQDQTICLQVTGYNRGGLLVSGDGLQGFVPISHLIQALPEGEPFEKLLESYLKRSLALKIIECDQERGRVVFSERAALAKPGSRNELLNTLHPGDRIHGMVTNITDFGVFVDLGGIEGLIHVSEISWGRVHHPGDVVEMGQQVEVFVISIEQDRARVALSLKRLYPNPWTTAESRYVPGQVVDAVITSIVPFGAFARLEEGLDGLIHASEISSISSVSLKQFLNEGQHVQVRVLHVDGARQRLGLSLYFEDNPA